MTSACEVNWLSEFSSVRGLRQAHSCKSHRQILQRAPWQAAPSLTSPPVFLDLDWHFKWNIHGTSWKEAIVVRWHLYPLSVRQQKAVGELLGCRWSVWCVGEKDAVLTNVTSLTGSDAGCASPLCLWVPPLYQIPPISTAKSREFEMKDLQMTAAERLTPPSPHSQRQLSGALWIARRKSHFLSEFIYVLLELCLFSHHGFFIFFVESQIVTFCVKSVSRMFVPHTDTSKLSLQTTCWAICLATVHNGAISVEEYWSMLKTK